MSKKVEKIDNASATAQAQNTSIDRLARLPISKIKLLLVDQDNAPIIDPETESQYKIILNSREFATGSIGYFASPKVDIGGIRCTSNLQFIVIGSKKDNK